MSDPSSLDCKRTREVGECGNALLMGGSGGGEDTDSRERKGGCRGEESGGGSRERARMAGQLRPNEGSCVLSCMCDI